MIDPRTILLLSRGLLQNRLTRRQIMFYMCIATMLLVFVGTFLLDGALGKSLILFVGYWGICLATTVFMLLMAVYDLLSVRAQHRSELRELRRRVADSVEAEAESERERQSRARVE